MMRIIKYKSRLVPSGFIGITLWPFIFISLSKDEYIDKYGKDELTKTIRHESIHLRQQVELLIIGLLIAIIAILFKAYIIAGLSLFLFYILYLINWIINLFVYGKKAYTNICFEREAYSNAENITYLEKRSLFNWIKYILK